jgi:hypothetical protein
MTSDQVEQLAGNDPHEEPRLFGLEPSATGLIQSKSEFALLDPVLHIASQEVYIITILVSDSDLIDTLANHLKE